MRWNFGRDIPFFAQFFQGALHIWPDEKVDRNILVHGRSALDRAEEPTGDLGLPERVVFGGDVRAGRELESCVENDDAEERGENRVRILAITAHECRHQRFTDWCGVVAADEVRNVMGNARFRKPVLLSGPPEPVFDVIFMQLAPERSAWQVAERGVTFGKRPIFPEPGRGCDGFCGAERAGVGPFRFEKILQMAATQIAHAKGEEMTFHRFSEGGHEFRGDIHCRRVSIDQVELGGRRQIFDEADGDHAVEQLPPEQWVGDGVRQFRWGDGREIVEGDGGPGQMVLSGHDEFGGGGMECAAGGANGFECAQSERDLLRGGMMKLHDEWKFSRHIV